MDRLITFRWQARSLGLYAIGRFEYKVSKHSGEVKYVYIYWLGVRPFYFIGQGLWEDEPKIVYGKAVRPQEATMFLKKRPCSPRNGHVRQLSSTSRFSCENSLEFKWIEIVREMILF